MGRDEGSRTRRRERSEAVSKISTRDGIVRRRRHRRESSRRVKHVLHRNLGDLWDGQLALRTVRFGHDVCDAGTHVTLAGAVIVGALGCGLHGGKRRSVLERQVADGRQVKLIGS